MLRIMSFPLCDKTKAHTIKRSAHTDHSLCCRIVSKLHAVSVAIKAGLCLTWFETPKYPFSYFKYTVYGMPQKYAERYHRIKLLAVASGLTNVKSNILCVCLLLHFWDISQKHTYRNIRRDNLHFSTFEKDCVHLCEYCLISY